LFAGFLDETQTPPETAQDRWKWVGTAAELQRERSPAAVVFVVPPPR
jgi:hypothetical protein